MTSFADDSSRPPALPSSRDDAFVDNGAVASKPCLSLAERRPRTAADGLLPADTASTATRTVFSWSLLSLTFGEEAKKRTSRTNNNQIAPPYWKKIIQMKSSQTLVFDPGGCCCCCCCCCCFLTLTDPLRIQPWSQDRRNQTKSNRESEMSMESIQKRTGKK